MPLFWPHSTSRTSSPSLNTGLTRSSVVSPFDVCPGVEWLDLGLCWEFGLLWVEVEEEEEEEEELPLLLELFVDECCAFPEDEEELPLEGAIPGFNPEVLVIFTDSC